VFAIGGKQMIEEAQMRFLLGLKGVIFGDIQRCEMSGIYLTFTE
jgi:hypothetical protein